MTIVYRIYDKNSGKSYIGQTRNFKERLARFKTRNRCGGGVDLVEDIQLKGFDNFAYEILLESSDQDEINSKEQFFIEEFDALFPKGYNKYEGGKKNFIPISHCKKVIDDYTRIIYYSVDEAAKSTGIPRSSILKSCKIYGGVLSSKGRISFSFLE